MPKHKYLPNNILFDDDVDENNCEDQASTSGFRSRIGPAPQQRPVSNAIDRQECVEQFLLKKKEIEIKTLESTSRSIALLEDAEDSAICAAKELAHQGEQLQSTNRKLDDIDSNLKISKKHINGIKSVFYEVKDYISSHSPPLLRRNRSLRSPSKSPSRSKLNANNKCQRPTTKNNDSCSSAFLHNKGNQIPDQHHNSQEVDDILKANCDTMSEHIARLKTLGIKLGEEIDQQVELIDTLQNKVESSTIKLGKQEKQINKMV